MSRFRLLAKLCRAGLDNPQGCIVFENNKPFVIDEFRNATPQLTRAEIPRLAPVDPQRAGGRGSENKINISPL